MSDLISRSALIKEIEGMYLSISGIRSGKGILSKMMEAYKKNILDVINEQPTVYDIDKVVEELERKKRTSVECLGERNGIGFNKVMDLAINIVRGGVE